MGIEPPWWGILLGDGKEEEVRGAVVEGGHVEAIDC